ncbi:MAG: hypothetical protein KKD44_13205 [Proteobacteria bacterium]|nr:hypothetical protein [Pseudomonadota bacterium]
MTRWIASISSVLIIIIYSGVVYSDIVTSTVAPEKRSDVIHIDSSNLSKKNERPPVRFPHDLHTDALAEKNEGCAACHSDMVKTRSFEFIKGDKVGYDNRMNGYHDRCIGCHTSSIASGEMGGPVICSGCHREQYTMERAVGSARFDTSLHQRHNDALNKSCESCHHVYDTLNKKTVYEKGKEGSCSYCHPEKENGKDMSLEKASHQQCVTCHETRKESGKTAGPVRCEGCHDPLKRLSYKKAEKIQRLPMGQKDFLMLQTKESQEDTTKNRMAFVPFDHKRHEEKNESCQICHHKALTGCTQCHTLTGSEKGGFNNLEKIMHDSTSTRSCTGCHKVERKAAECSGCHTFESDRAEDNKGCIQCHLTLTLSEDQQKQAQDLIEQNIQENIHDDFSKVPEKLVLNKMEKTYQPVVFPHRKIVQTLSDKIKNNRMAQYFHQDKNTLCMGCHHKTPSTDTPTACSSCHTAVKMDSDTFKPGLLGAYHIQCMECHARMGIRQPESCTQCHKEKN